MERTRVDSEKRRVSDEELQEDIRLAAAEINRYRGLLRQEPPRALLDCERVLLDLRDARRDLSDCRDVAKAFREAVNVMKDAARPFLAGRVDASGEVFVPFPVSVEEFTRLKGLVGDQRLDLRGLVAELEWSVEIPNGDDLRFLCPWCHNPQQEGHRQGCKVAMALGRAVKA